MISTSRQYGGCSPMVAQYHLIRDKKVRLFNKITRGVLHHVTIPVEAEH